jgi:hypothetical protein
MSTSTSGATYTYVSGITITSGGAGNMIGGGRGMPILMFTSADAGFGTTIATTQRIVHKSSFFIFPLLVGFSPAPYRKSSLAVFFAS